MEFFTILKKDLERAKNNKSFTEVHVDDDDLDAGE
jgi:hypothetical protein